MLANQMDFWDSYILFNKINKANHVVAIVLHPRRLRVLSRSPTTSIRLSSVSNRS